ncbi:MAG: hypothetical protein HYU36_07585 [Planctomycetes bacterium]|nr:hypothetical protein [Planctomycetota bacterium]
MSCRLAISGLLLSLLPARVASAESTAPAETGPPVACVARHYPTFEVLELSWDLTSLQATPLDALAIEVHFIDLARKEIIFSQGWKDLKSYSPGYSLSTSRLPEGRYALISVIGANRKEVARTVHPLVKFPPPAWKDNTLGLGDQIPPPFERVEVEGSRALEGRKIRVWGRTYDFGRSALPDQITVGGEPILAGPITLLAERKNGRVRDLARDLMWGKGAGNPIEVRLDLQRHGRAEWESSSSTGDTVRPGISGWAEYDGLVWLRLFVGGREWPSLATLRLEIPLARKWATLVNAGDPSLAGTGRVPSDGLVRRPDPLWLGCERGGLQWLTELSSLWPLQQPDKAVRVIPREKDTLLQVTFVDHDIDLSLGFHAEFGLIATPVRPAGYWDFLRGNLEEGYWEPRGYLHSVAIPWPGAASPALAQPGNLHFDRNAKDTPERVPSIMLGLCAPDDPASADMMAQTLQYYFYEWTPRRDDVLKPGIGSLALCAASKSWQDFLVWSCLKNYEVRRFTGLACDTVLPVLADNFYAGGGVRDGERVHPKWVVLGTRDLAKRLYAMLRAREPKGSIRYHLPGRRLASLLAFCEMTLDGDSLAEAFSEARPHLYQHLSLDAFRAQYLGSNFGPSCAWLPPQHRALETIFPSGKKAQEIFDNPDRETRWTAGIALLHQVSIGPVPLPGDASSLLEAARTLRLNSADFAFTGYWEEPPARVEPQDENLVVSVYREKQHSGNKPGGRALLVLFNNSDWEGEARIDPAWEALQMQPGQCRIENTAFGDPVRVDGRAVIVPITRRDVRLISIRSKAGP